MKFINWLLMAIWVIINPPCDKCGYNGCAACEENQDGN